jgi:3-deoxy-D-manno-octulosonate 8-phosphate phosphatase (KDO 8-P phosphatase)
MTEPLTPTLQFAPALLEKAKGIRAVIFDVDGVLTDGRIYISEQGEEFKAFNTLDGHGIKLLSSNHITPLIITGRDSKALRQRVRDLGLIHAYYGVHDKLAVAQTLLKKLQLEWFELAAMGDDWPDLPLMQRAACACAPNNAHIEVKAVAHLVTTRTGGHGAARQFCDLLLMANNCYASSLNHSLKTLDHGKS